MIDEFIDGFIDKADALFARWSSVLSILSIGSFIASCAAYAGFIAMPNLLPLPDWLGILPAVLWNALWWGFAYPRIEARRKQRAQLEHSDG